MAVAGIDQEDLEPLGLEQLVQGDPVDAGRFQGDGRDAAVGQPVGQGLQVGGAGAEAATGRASGSGGDGDRVAAKAEVNAAGVAVADQARTHGTPLRPWRVRPHSPGGSGGCGRGGRGTGSRGLAGFVLAARHGGLHNTGVGTEPREAGGGASWGWTVTRPNEIAQARPPVRRSRGTRLSRTNGGTERPGHQWRVEVRDRPPHQHRESGPLPLLAMSGPRSGLRRRTRRCSRPATRMTVLGVQRPFPREPAAFLSNARGISVGMPAPWVRTAIARLRPAPPTSSPPSPRLAACRSPTSRRLRTHRPSGP